jgi:hypothetical protein
MRAPLSFLLLIVSFLGCKFKSDEKFLPLGEGYVLFRLHGGNVYVENMKTTNEIGIPPVIDRLGYSSDYIVASVVTNRATNFWVIYRNSRTRMGPLDESAFRELRSTNQLLEAVKLKDVWDY